MVCRTGSIYLITRLRHVFSLVQSLPFSNSKANWLLTRLSEFTQNSHNKQTNEKARTGASSPRPLYLTECLLIGPKENAA